GASSGAFWLGGVRFADREAGSSAQFLVPQRRTDLKIRDCCCGGGREVLAVTDPLAQRRGVGREPLGMMNDRRRTAGSVGGGGGGREVLAVTDPLAHRPVVGIEPLGMMNDRSSKDDGVAGIEGVLPDQYTGFR